LLLAACRLGRDEDKVLLSFAGVTCCKMERGHGHSLSRGGEEGRPRPLKKHTLLAP